MDLVVGGGKFGLKAVEFLLRSRRDFIVIDTNPECEVSKKLKVKVIKAGAEKIAEIAESISPEWIYPTAPLHVAAEALKNSFEPWNEAIELIIPLLPAELIVSAGRGTVVLSYNIDGVCIENCSSPKICPATGLERSRPIFEIIRSLCPEAIVLISHQIAPGLGAIRGSEFIEAIRWAKRKEKVFIGTACECHGVLTAMRRRREL